MKLFLLHLGFLQPLGVPIPGYVIQTDEGINVLVDTGFPYSFIAEPPGPMGPLQLQVAIQPDDFIVRRLESIGLTPGDIDLLVCTHFDIDHAGNYALFDKAELVVQRRHLEVAQAGHPRFDAFRTFWGAPDFRYRLIDGDIVLLPGIELLETSGHVPGHQSVLVRLPQTGPVLLAIDAVPHSSMVDPDTRVIMPNDMDEAETRASTRKLAGIAQREGVQLVVHGHDSDQWPTLKHAPVFYD